MILFCLAHAGASTLAYNKWKRLLDDSIEFISLELPGHGVRHAEPLVVDFNIALEILYVELLSKLRKSGDAFAIFGHSLGALFAYELYYRLELDSMPRPVRLFFSGRLPPCSDEPINQYDFSSKSNVLKYMEENDLLKESVFEEKKVNDYFINILLHDFMLIHSYVYKNRENKIISNITVLWGDADISTPFSGLKKWTQTSYHHIQFVQIKGNHFFPTQNVEGTLSIINSALVEY